MKTDEKITLWSERIIEFHSSGQPCKAWCQEHHIPVNLSQYTPYPVVRPAKDI